MNKEIREIQRRVIEQLHGSTTTLKDAMTEMGRLHPEYKEYIKEIGERILKELEKLPSRIKHE